jgi:translation elongation factor P/translation initiation factor 5A
LIPRVTLVPTRDGLWRAAEQIAQIHLTLKKMEWISKQPKWWQFWRSRSYLSCDWEERLYTMTRWHVHSLKSYLLEGRHESYEQFTGVPVEVKVEGDVDLESIKGVSVP